MTSNPHPHAHGLQAPLVFATSFLSRLRHPHLRTDMKELRAKLAKVTPTASTRVYLDQHHETPVKSSKSRDRNSFSERETGPVLVQKHTSPSTTPFDRIDETRAMHHHHSHPSPENALDIPPNTDPPASSASTSSHTKSGRFQLRRGGSSSRSLNSNSSQKEGSDKPQDENEESNPFDNGDELGDSNNNKNQKDRDSVVANEEDEVAYFSQRIGNSDFKLRQQRVLHPHGRPRAAWDVLTLVLIAWILISVPFELTFDEIETATRRGMLTVDLAVDVAFCLDIILNFMTAVENDGKLHFSFRSIRRYYLRGWFVLDVMWTIPLYIWVAHPLASPLPSVSWLTELNEREPWLYPFFRCIRACRVFSISRIQRRLEYSLRISSTASSLGSFLLTVMALSHVFSCGFAYLAFGKQEHLSVALESHTLEENTAMTKYIGAFYWAMMTMTTVGYGDLTVRTNVGRIFSITAMAVGGGVFAYGISNVVSLIQQLYVDEAEHRHKMDQVNSFMHTRSLSRRLCDEIRANFFHLKKATREKKLQDQLLFKQMSRTIQSRVATAFCEDMMPTKMPFLAGCNAEFIHELYLTMQVKCYIPGEDIIRQDEYGTELFFLFAGHVQVFLGHLKVAAFGPNTCFGEFGIFNPRKPRLATIQAMDFCETHCVERQELLRILLRYPFMLNSIKQLATLKSKKALNLLYESGGKSRTLLQGFATTWHAEGILGLLPQGLMIDDMPMLAEYLTGSGPGLGQATGPGSGPGPTTGPVLLSGFRGSSIRTTLAQLTNTTRRKSVVDFIDLNTAAAQLTGPNVGTTSPHGSSGNSSNGRAPAESPTNASASSRPTSASTAPRRRKSLVANEIKDIAQGNAGMASRLMVMNMQKRSDRRLLIDQNRERDSIPLRLLRSPPPSAVAPPPQLQEAPSSNEVHRLTSHSQSVPQLQIDPSATHAPPLKPHGADATATTSLMSILGAVPVAVPPSEPSGPTPVQTSNKLPPDGPLTSDLLAEMLRRQQALEHQLQELTELLKHTTLPPSAHQLLRKDAHEDPVRPIVPPLKRENSQ